MPEKPSSARWRHDMKNQIGIVLGFTELLLQETDENHSLRGDLEEIAKAVRQAMALVEELEKSTVPDL
jgi:signal transduction histidine kinase